MTELALTNDINEGIRIQEGTTGALLIDVRDADDYEDGHVPGSMNVPLNHIEDHIEAAVPDRGTSLFIYCARGVRSMEAASILQEMGYADATSIGGIDGYAGTLSTE